MSANFPTSLDTYTTKASGNTIQAAHVNDLQDAVSALEAKVGADGSSVAASHTKKIADLTTLTNILSSVTASAAELNIMDGVTATTAELNKLDADNLTTGDLLTKGASAIEVIAAVAATQYFKSAGVGAKPAYGKLALSDTGVKVVSFTHTAGTTGDQTITGAGFTPSVAVILFTNGNDQLGVCLDTASTRGCLYSSGGTNIGITSTYSITNTTDSVRATLSSFNSDGCVISWTKHLPTPDISGFILFLP